MVGTKQIHPRGIPVPRGPLALAIADSKSPDYNWLKFREVMNFLTRTQKLYQK